MRRNWGPEASHSASHSSEHWGGGTAAPKVPGAKPQARCARGQPASQLRQHLLPPLHPVSLQLRSCLSHLHLTHSALGCPITCSQRGTVPSLVLATLRHLHKDPLMSRIPTLRPAAPQWLCQASGAEAEATLGSGAKFCPIHKPGVPPPTAALALPLHFLGDYLLNPEYG